MSEVTSMQTAVSFQFDMIFLNEEKPSYEELLYGIPSSIILERIGHINAHLYSNERNEELQREIVLSMIKYLSREIKDKVYGAIERIKKENKNNSITFFTFQTSLKFIEKVLEYYTVGEKCDLTVNEQERLFKALLLISQEWIEDQINFFNKIDLSTPDKLVEFMLPIQLPFSDIQESSHFIRHVYKGMEFFRYCEKHEVLAQYINEFIDELGISSWREYIKEVVGTFVNLFHEGHKSILITRPGSRINSMLDDFSLDVENYERKTDFISLREKPVYKLKEYSYLIYHYPLFINKIFQAMIFDFGRFIINKGVCKNIPDFKSKFISKDFFEQYLFYDLSKYIVSRRKKAFQLNGLDWAKQYGEEGPDYFVKCGNKLFIIEFKDALFQADAKVSYDFDIIKRELNKKLKENDKGKPKGVRQLANLINKISNKEIEIKKLNYEQIIVYPILVITDEAFNEFGINYLMNKEFKSLLSERSNDISKDLVIIHIDQFIELQDLFHEKRLTVKDALEFYINYTKYPKGIYDPYTSFAKFIYRDLYNRNLKYKSIPKRLDKMLESITD